ncbi:MAG: tRNA (adenosine(37)-N6)-threonylcarbamoyltransferase complex dimerization subunit type 1 TsaB [Wenzhouxiangella sp.]|nr:MAG: tRNA (adenosine(37)-N6)-threonylcarbamoyltransferase complex dimerization subunit type 1 TsaB [Wenzhouxiangella sp.]
MIRLAIETSTEACSVALQFDATVLSRRIVEARAHARLILPWVDELLAEAGTGFEYLDELVVSRGPGGFTSLRIGLSVVQGIALAHDLPVRPVSSLDALAARIRQHSPAPQLLALLDARMNEVYGAWFQCTGKHCQRLGPEFLASPEQLKLPAPGPWTAAGPGAVRYREQLKDITGLENQGTAIEAWPDAEALLLLADDVEAVPGHRLEPVYLRNQVTG